MRVDKYLLRVLDDMYLTYITTLDQLVTEYGSNGFKYDNIIDMQVTDDNYLFVSTVSKTTEMSYFFHKIEKDGKLAAGAQKYSTSTVLFKSVYSKGRVSFIDNNNKF